MSSGLSRRSLSPFLGDRQFFEVRDIEGHLIEICKEP